MRLLKLLTVGMGVLIVVATTILVATVARRLSAPGATAPLSVLLEEPTGTEIAGVTGAGERLAVLLRGGGPDRVVLVDPRSGAVAGRVALRAGGS
jgi:Family of unknown function (DUF6476)